MNERPNPDELLVRTQSEEREQGRGGLPPAHQLITEASRTTPTLAEVRVHPNYLESPGAP